MARRLALVVALSLLGLALPAIAQGAVYCVNAAGCTGIAEPDLQSALTAAMATTAEADSVQVGTPGTAPAGGWQYSDLGNSANEVQIIGSGPATTVLSAPTASTTLAILAPGSSISNLSVQLPNAPETGIATSGRLSNVDVPSRDDGSHAQTGAILTGTGGTQSWTKGAITLPTSGAASHVALVRSGPPETVDLQDLSLAAVSGGLFSSAGDDITLRRVSIVSGLGSVNQGAHLTLDNVVFQALPPPAPGIFLITDPAVSNNGTSDLNHVTAYGSGMNGAYGLAAFDTAGHSATVNVRNSILRNFFFLINRSASNTGGAANVNVSYSDIDLIHKLDSNSGGATGAITVGPGMIDTDPLFTSPSTGDFRLRPGSLAIDGGDPAGFQPGDSATDVLGAPRISNGRQDMGALELQVAPPAPAAVKDTTAPTAKIAKLPKRLKLRQITKGFSFSVTPSEPSSIDVTLAGSARSVRLAKSFNLTLAHKKLRLAAGKRKVSLRVKKKLLGHSRRFTVRLTLVLTDAAGNKSTVRRSLKVR
jgi:hypothetical protein